MFTHTKYWGLREAPFPSRADARHCFISASHREALARLTYLVEDSRRLGLLLGAPGTGKSHALEAFARELRDRRCQVARVSLTATDPRQLLSDLATGLHIELPPHAGRYEHWRALEDRLIEHRYQRLATVLLLDDAGRLTSEVVDQVLRLIDLDPGSGAQLSIVAATTPEGASRLGPELLDRVYLRADLEPWDEAEVGQFVETALAAAGARRAIFTAAAIQRLYETTDGVARRVAQFAELALVAAAGEGLAEIGPETIDSVARELGLPAWGESAAPARS